MKKTLDKLIPSDAPKRKVGRPKQNIERELCKKMFLIDKNTNEVLRDICHEHRISFSELIRKMIDYMMEKKWKYFSK